MRTHCRGRTFAAQVLLCFLFPAAADAGFQIQDNRLLLDGEPFPIRGVVYSNVPIGEGWSDETAASSCLYARDFPLIAGLGANTVRTLAMVRPGDRAFQNALDSSDLYWLAGFPLDRFHDKAASLSPASEPGAALRSRILTEFRAFMETWKSQPRLIAFVFGEDVGAGYGDKFSGSVADFYSLLGEAAAIVLEAGGINPPLLTTTTSQVAEIGSFVSGSDDIAQPGLAFWSVNHLGNESLEGVFQDIRRKTAKPFLISAFGIDAYDGENQLEDPEVQAASARARAIDIQARIGSSFLPLLGGLWAGFVDEWWRGGANSRQDFSGAPNERFPDKRLHPEWMGLFTARTTALRGLDSLRPRPAYFALAEQWAGSPPDELTMAGPPLIDPGAISATSSTQKALAPGGLVTFRGTEFASEIRFAEAGNLPLQLGPVSACASRLPLPLQYADEGELRGQVPWNSPTGALSAVIYRAGVASNAASLEVVPSAPAIFDRGVFRPSLPCPVDDQNGVRPGTYLEVYATGLGLVSGPVVNGLAPTESLLTAENPAAILGGRPIRVLYSGLLPGVAGVYQTNVQVPADFPVMLAELRLQQGSASSNPHLMRVVEQQETPSFTLGGPEPDAIVLQQGGPAQTTFVEIQGFNSFCELVRFELTGLPAGVSATIPVGVPGQILPLTISADVSAPLLSGITTTLTALSSSSKSVSRALRLTILPSRTDLTFRVISGGWLSTAPVASFELNDNLLHKVHGGGPGRGFNFLTLDPQTGTLGPIRVFDTFDSQADLEAMEDYLRAIPLGSAVLGAIADEGTHLLTGQTRQIIRETLGSQLIDFVGFQYSWAIITRKNATQPIAEGLSPNGLVVLERTLSFPLP